ncbi:uncharacterized protein LOC115970397 [Quercus lobata]|uniref:uncharacterized protein LOC115970397 n=1 Tax=Quercus lobata TaxID=97700 RepID=UPI001248ADD9|nr:uncharacterized protein LOC115970397 [Quercus lobata]
MEQEVIDSLQKLRLIKEEEEDILITNTSRPDLIEECSLSFFRRLLTNHHQNQRALKNTLRQAWKMGSDLRIVEVGKGILQFKFNSMYQLDWVGKSGPWNFDSKLLLLCRWRKGLSVSNITFTHSPFWVQVWGLPFEQMSKEVGKNIGRKIGKVIEVDKWSLQADQAKFLRARVDMPIDKPLRRRGYVAIEEGGRSWVTFKYERLPTFCFIYGMLGHDDRYCAATPSEQSPERQYEEWLRVGGISRFGGEKAKA